MLQNFKLKLTFKIILSPFLIPSWTSFEVRFKKTDNINRSKCQGPGNKLGVKGISDSGDNACHLLYPATGSAEEEKVDVFLAQTHLD